MSDRTREDQDFTDERYGSEHGPYGNWLPAECVICGETTQTRCAACHLYVCHCHPECPNGCDNSSNLVERSPR
jgi:hypothetical protein